jgi:NAD(P)-dependent dehydrogenase (short-subunit alcohol dehydrogenase family)
VKLTGKVAIVTGANTGIGYETALDFYGKGAKIYIASRDEKRALDAIQRMKATTEGGELIYVHLDLESLNSVKEFAEKVIARESRLDL